MKGFEETPAGKDVTIDKVRWTDDTDAVTMLADRGIKYRVLTIPLSHVDVEGSIKRNNRIERTFDDERAIDIGSQIEQYGYCKRIVGILMPPGVKGNPSRTHEMLDILGGNHRTRGVALLGVKAVQAYVLDTDDTFLIEDIRNNLNNLTGEGNSARVRLANAYTEITKHHVDFRVRAVLEPIAKRYSLKVERLQTYAASQAAREVIENHGFTTENLTDSHLRTLQSLSDSHTVMARAGALCNRGKFNVKMTNDLVQSIRNEKRGEAHRIAKIEAAEHQFDELQKSNKGSKTSSRPSRPVYNMLLDNLTRVKNFFERHPVESLQITSAEQWREVEALVQPIVAIFGQIVKPKEPESASRTKRRRRRTS